MCESKLSPCDFNKEADRGLVNKIIPFSCVDGPGNRSSIFFQACDFRCRYCHNPETQALCINCGACVEVCPTGALSLLDGKVIWNEDKCCACDKCLGVCTHNSTPKTKLMTVDDIVAELGTALPFITGITVSGGECTFYHRFITRLFRRFHELGKTAFADTNGQLLFKDMPWLTDEMDMAMLDIKAWSEDKHRLLTGRGNKTVIENFHYLADINKLYEVRTVVIPDYLDNEETVTEVSKVLKNYPDIRYKLIKFRPWGVRPAMNVSVPSDEYMNRLKKLAMDIGVSEVVIS
ncbi:MAG: YjjW family glycine radical enzyme activase [Eubacteriales bacterium]|nr:YjjW family glycine radical enzyme activase [Eubacteriales bacterium]